MFSFSLFALYTNILLWVCLVYNVFAVILKSTISQLLPHSSFLSSASHCHCLTSYQGSFRSWNWACSELLPASACCGTLLFGPVCFPPPPHSTLRFLLWAVCRWLGPDLGGSWQSSGTRDGPGGSIPEPWPCDPHRNTACPWHWALSSGPQETHVQLLCAGQMAAWFNIDQVTDVDSFFAFSPSISAKVGHWYLGWSELKTTSSFYAFMLEFWQNEDTRVYCWLTYKVTKVHFTSQNKDFHDP